MDPTLEPIKSWIGPCGALMVSAFVPNCTQALDGETASFYGGKYFVGETITIPAARSISKAMGWEFVEEK